MTSRVNNAVLVFRAAKLLNSIVEEERSRNRKIHLVFGASRLTGLAGHLQALRILEQSNIMPDTLYGSQLGSVCAAMYAQKIPARKLWYYLVKELNSKEIFDFRVKDILKNTVFLRPFRLDGICGGKNIRAALSVLFDEPVDPNPQNLYIFAEYLEKNRLKMFHPPQDIDVTDAIRAATSLTALYPPFRYRKTLYVDSGLLGGLPLKEVILHHKIKKRQRKKHTIIAFQEAFTKEYSELTLAERMTYSFVEKVRYHSALLDIEFAKQSGIRLILVSFFAKSANKSLVNMSAREKFALMDNFSLDITNQLDHYLEQQRTQRKWNYDNITPLSR